MSRFFRCVVLMCTRTVTMNTSCLYAHTAYVFMYPHTVSIDTWCPDHRHDVSMRIYRYIVSRIYGFVLQHIAAHCNALHHTKPHCSTMNHTAAHCSTLQHTATHCNTLQHTATHCYTLQHIATHCNTLQHTATH